MWRSASNRLGRNWIVIFQGAQTACLCEKAAEGGHLSVYELTMSVASSYRRLRRSLTDLEATWSIVAIAIEGGAAPSCQKALSHQPERGDRLRKGILRRLAGANPRCGIERRAAQEA